MLWWCIHETFIYLTTDLELTTSCGEVFQDVITTVKNKRYALRIIYYKGSEKI